MFERHARSDRTCPFEEATHMFFSRDCLGGRAKEGTYISSFDSASLPICMAGGVWGVMMGSIVETRNTSQVTSALLLPSTPHAIDSHRVTRGKRERKRKRILERCPHESSYPMDPFLLLLPLETRSRGWFLPSFVVKSHDDLYR